MSDDNQDNAYRDRLLEVAKNEPESNYRWRGRIPAHNEIRACTHKIMRVASDGSRRLAGSVEKSRGCGNGRVHPFCRETEKREYARQIRSHLRKLG